jgi:ferric enterobactin receptor
MRRSLAAALTFASAASAFSLSAQQPAQPAAQQPARPAGGPAGGPPAAPVEGELRGTVLESEGGTPVARASVAVRSRRDSALVTGAITGAQGTFRIQGLRPGAYFLRVTTLGYAPQVRQFQITPAAPRAAFDSIRLTKVAVSLSAMNVVEERGAVQMEADRNAYRAKDVAPAAANASDVLESVPAVQVDADGKVSYRGNENVVVQINGRPTPIRGAQLASYLKTLPANVVDKVEVIPNPSAKYDPDGMAGILNIVLKQQVDLGLSGGFNASAANRDRYNASGNIGYQVGKWTTFTSAGFNADERGVTGVNDRERYRAGAPLSFTNQDVFGRNGFNGVNLTQTVEYKFNKRDALYTSGTVNRRTSIDDATNTYEELNATRALLETYDRFRDTDAKGLFFDANVAFKRTFDPKKRHDVNVELRFNRGHDEDATGLWRQPLGVGGASALAAGAASAARVENEMQQTDAVQRQAIAQIDYVRTLDKRRKVELGYKGDARWLDRDYTVDKDALGTGAWTRSNLSNAFQFDERVQAVYGQFSQGVGKFEMQGGLRAEYASRDFALRADSKTYPYDYTSLFPSANVMFNKSDATQFKASYSRRIRRPGTQELNPFPAFFDVQNVFIGNPNLSPEYTDALELGVMRQGKYGTFQFAPFYRYTKNVIRVDINTEDVVDGRDVTTISFKNLATSNSWGADVNGTLRFGKKLNALGGFNVFRMVTDGGSTSAVGSDAVAWMARTNVTYNVSSKTTLQGQYFYRAPMKIERGQFSAQQNANFVLRQKIDGDKASLLVRVVDPFNTMRFSIRTGNETLMQTTQRTPGVRAVFLGYQYNFGRPPRVREPRPSDQPQSGPGFPG